MRPDEHKRKKNEKYKKKHQLSGENSKESVRNQTARISDSSQTRTTAQRRHDDNQKFASKAYDKEEETEAERKLPDNWDRYEEIEEDEICMPEVRGEDFNKLIAESGDSSSRFRFKDEEEWNDDNGNESEHWDSAVTLDFENLSLAMSCVPLNERLGLPEDLFTDKQIEEITKTAYQSKIKYEKTNSEQESAIKCHSETKTKLADTTRKPKLVPCAKSDKLSKVSDKYDFKKTNKSEDRLQADISSLEEDLDSLLSVKAPSVRDMITNKTPAVKKSDDSEDVPSLITKASKIDQVKEQSSGSTEDWLDELLACYL